MYQILIALPIFVTWIVYTMLQYYCSGIAAIGGICSAITSYSAASHWIDTVWGAGDAVTSWATTYIVVVGILYIVYKTISVLLTDSTYTYRIWHILVGFLVQLLVVCIFFFSDPGTISFYQTQIGTAVPGGAGMSLFFGILGYLVYPLSLVVILRSLSATLLPYIHTGWADISYGVRFLLEIAIGFLVFTTCLLVFGVFGFFNIFTLLGILALFAILSYREIYTTLRLVYTLEIPSPVHTTRGVGTVFGHISLVISEFLFIVLTLLVAVNLVSIYRPMPIGWDDLGVYMNYAQIMANSGEMLQGAGMYTWQIVTSTGFLFGNSATQAFFLNQLGGLLSILAILIGISALTTHIGTVGTKKSFLPLPLLFATLFTAMPMVIFQQAKDMKLDPALFFFSIVFIIGLFYVYRKNGEMISHDSGKIDTLGHTPAVHTKASSVHTTVHTPAPSRQSSVTSHYIYFLILGLILGLCFSIKPTTIMLIVSTFGYIFYRQIGLAGFFGFFGIFIAIFTRLHLWDMLFVPYPGDDAIFVNMVTYIFGFGGIGLVALGYILSGENKNISFKTLISQCLAVGIGLFVALFPWFTKNTYEVVSTPAAHISIGTIMGGVGGTYTPDYTQIYTQSEIDTIVRTREAKKSASGKAKNEDLERYFGYEKGINNYLKLPVNLTFQKNQEKEYTDITYIFFALLPAVFLFIRSRYYSLAIGTVGILFALFAYYFGLRIGTLDTAKYLSDIFGSVSMELPMGYVVIFGLFILSVCGIHFATHRPTDSDIDSTYTPGDDMYAQNLRDTSIFFGLYCTIYAISAFGIVWYGIPMYFGFFLLIVYALAPVLYYTDTESEDILTMKSAVAYIVLFTVVLYLCISSIPHALYNLRTSAFQEYKTGKHSQEFTIFRFRHDYLQSLAAINLRDPSTAYTAVKNIACSASIRGATSTDIDIWHSTFTTLDARPDALTDCTGVTSISAKKKQISKMADTFYSTILYPPADTANTSTIYRIGTFMTYFISDNRKRYMDDSLVQGFEDYFYDPVDREKSISKMKKMGIGLLLVDLNAGTIDRDPLRDLSRRYEHLATVFPSTQMTLVDTDNLCLRTAVDSYQAGLISSGTYLDMATANIHSFSTGDTLRISSAEKKTLCYNHMLELMKGGKVNVTTYSYLQGIMAQIKPNMKNDELLATFGANAPVGTFALFRMKE